MEGIESATSPSQIMTLHITPSRGDEDPIHPASPLSINQYIRTNL